MVITRTLNPLPLEHLDPKRFEDLVRQLLYDFKPWRSLEATGRSGSDDGFDARGIEAPVGAALAADVDDENSEDLAPVEAERVWLIQCKREKNLPPKRLLAHLGAIPPKSVEGLYGFILATVCDLSKAARDVCRCWASEQGIQEVHLWGRSEIEDQLFQPKNDNLLFAYFGISLQIRRQNATTRLRRITTLKRKLRKLEGENSWLGTPVILRDPSDERYPQIDRRAWDRGEYLWEPRYSQGLGVTGLRILLRNFYAYYDPDSGEWDFATGFDYTYPFEAEELWPTLSRRDSKAAEIVDAWSQLPSRHQHFFKIVGSLPYTEMLEIDEVGDVFCSLATIFCNFTSGEPPFGDRTVVMLEPSGGYAYPVSWQPEKHVRVFPEELRNPTWENDWTQRNGITLSENLIPLPLRDTEPERRE